MYKNQLINLRPVIYSLKNDYGFRLDLYRKDEVVNLETGRKITTRIKYKIKKAILLPNQMFRDFNYGTIIKTGGNAQVGGILDLRQRIILIDKRELPRNFEIDSNDYVVFNHDRYEIREIMDLELGDFYRLTIREVEGESPYEVHEQIINEKFELNDFVDNSYTVEYFVFKDEMRFKQSFQKYIVHTQQVNHRLSFVDGIGEIYDS
jgi:hypothetical protein